MLIILGIFIAFRIDPTGFQATATARLTAPFIANYAQPTESSITKRDAQPTASTIRNAHITKRANIFKREVKPTKKANIVKRNVKSLANFEFSRKNKFKIQNPETIKRVSFLFLNSGKFPVKVKYPVNAGL